MPAGLHFAESPLPEIYLLAAAVEGVVDGHSIYNEGVHDEGQAVGASGLFLEHPRGCYSESGREHSPKIFSLPVFGEGPVRDCAWDYVLEGDDLINLYRGEGEAVELIPVGESRLIRWHYRYFPGDGWEREPDHECWWDFAEEADLPLVDAAASSSRT